MLEVADRTRDIAVIAGIVDVVMAEGVSAFEVEQAFRDAGAQSYLVGHNGKLTIVLGMAEMLAAVAELGITADENRARLKE
jgi:hypothetical protein